MDLIGIGIANVKCPCLDHEQAVLIRTPTQVEFVESWSETIRNGIPPVVVDDPGNGTPTAVVDTPLFREDPCHNCSYGPNNRGNEEGITRLKSKMLPRLTLLKCVVFRKKRISPK